MELIDKYPWLCPKRTENGGIHKDYDYSWTLLDDLPQGWRTLVITMCERIKCILEELDVVDKYMVLDAKEKYGALSWFDCMSDMSRVPQEVLNTVRLYERISPFFCPICGKFKSPKNIICMKCEDKI